MFTPEDLYTICVNTNGTEVVGLPTIDTGLSTDDYTFEWIDPNGVTVGLDPSYTATEAGTFTVIITDIVNTCFSVIPVIVEESSPPLVDAVVATGAFADTSRGGDALQVYKYKHCSQSMSREESAATHSTIPTIRPEHIKYRYKPRRGGVPTNP